MLEIIPDFGEMDRYERLAADYSLGYEYNDFYAPGLLDDAGALKERMNSYRKLNRPAGSDTLHGAFFDIVPFSYDSGIRKHSLYRMQQSVEIAEELGCRAVIFHTGIVPAFCNNGKYYRNWLETMGNTVRMLVEQSSRVEIYMENMFDDSPLYLAQLAETLKDVNRFGVCLDIAHMMLVTKEPEEWFKLLSPCIRHFHLNDNHLRTDEHLALGQGCICWKYIFELMSGYQLEEASRLIEVNGLNRITASLEYLKESGIFSQSCPYTITE